MWTPGGGSGRRDEVGRGVEAAARFGGESRSDRPEAVVLPCLGRRAEVSRRRPGGGFCEPGSLLDGELASVGRQPKAKARILSSELAGVLWGEKGGLHLGQHRDGEVRTRRQLPAFCSLNQPGWAEFWLKGPHCSLLWPPTGPAASWLPESDTAATLLSQSSPKSLSLGTAASLPQLPAG